MVDHLDVRGIVSFLGNAAHAHTVPVRTGAAFEKGLTLWRERIPQRRHRTTSAAGIARGGGYDIGRRIRRTGGRSRSASVGGPVWGSAL